MSNHFVINRPSNLIIGVVCTSYTPLDSKIKRFVVASTKALDVYYKRIRKDPDTHIDVGELMVMSEYFKEKLKEAIPFSDEGKSTPQRIRYRQPESFAETQDRQASIFLWLDSNQPSDAYDLNDKFGIGMLAARAYIEKYHLTK